ncbi:alpha/beta-type small acid-soluble spore protein [Pseudoflavonifractor phocaeensis]|uniref:alpha/beta-type small acid-soluble spore protein n=1 Tax=Pseudoflavonifractor phocaeensis TaxID=1870988 RepID=UPI001F464B5B|nr:alpha/beta-type small acid-soluble spore protein [Pseudoflavonifractor phocaeensis]MCF2660890.1 alpha/beta-type small acid-soluble spore protein [Pseudoflavonifractor phocaeensis]
MSNGNGSNKIMVPNAREAMNKFKMEAANEVGVNLKQGYNGDLTSKQAGSVGGQMVKKMTTARTMSFQRADRTAVGHEVEVRYIAGITV